MDAVLVVEKSEAPGIAVQCDLLLPNGHLQRTYEFDITDVGIRRRLVRRFYGILIVYIYPVILIFEILGLMLYSSQNRFRFTQIRGISIISLIFGLFLLLAYRLNRMMEVFSAMACTVEAWYIIYDTHYMLCGRHGYNIGPEEFVFAACNIHCDLPKGMWRLMKMLFFSKIVEAVRMFRECFRTEGRNLRDSNIPKWRSFKIYIRELTQMYTPKKSELKNFKSKEIAPRASGKQFIDPRTQNSIKIEKYKIKPPMSLPVPTATSSKVPAVGLFHGLISRFVFTQKRTKKLKKRSQLNNLQPKKTYKRSIINKSKVFKLPPQHQKRRKNEVDNNLKEVVSVMQELGEFKGIKTPKKVTERRHRTILRKFSRNALNLQTAHKNLSKYKISTGEIQRYTTYPEPSKTPAKRIKTNEFKKESQLNLKPNKTYKRSIVNKSKLSKLSVQHQKRRKSEVSNKLKEVVSVMQELDDFKDIKTPKRQEEKMNRTILKKFSGSAISLQAAFADLLKYTVPTKKSQRDSKTTAKRIRNNEYKMTKSSGNKGFDFKLGKGLKIHDYGFKNLKRAVSKQDTINDSKSHTPREAEIISNRKAFRTMDTNLRNFTRQTATNIFINVDRLSDKKVGSKLELLEQLNRLEILKHGISDNFEYFEESVSPLGYEVSEKLNRTFASIKRINQSRTNAEMFISDGRDSPLDFLTYDDDQGKYVPLAEEKPQPPNRRRKKRSKQFVVPQTDAGTQTECECEICSSLQKYKTEKDSPLLIEMAMKRDFLDQRQYYMENLTNRKLTAPVSEKRQSISLTKPNRSFYDAQHRNHEDVNLYSHYPNIISETFENLTSPLPFDNYTRELFKAYKALDVTKMLSQCYQTLFEAEQRTNGILPKTFDP
ncbi:GM20993 [Drosophila sechellia]|uniref:GM20993 n=1 Tax=Drosophila sechellia TaxID=7238 RepID=B4HRG4_DROSE|nr:GM20993 [Drosophila sechellia]